MLPAGRPAVALLLLLAAVLANGPARAQTVRAYMLIETSEIDTARRSLGSLANCKALDAALMPSELVVHIECNDLASLNEVLTSHVPAITGVSRVTTWLVGRGE